MKYVSEKYEAQLSELAENLMAAKREQLAQPSGELALVAAEVRLPETARIYEMPQAV